MGLLLNVDLETSLGPTHEAYVTVEGIRANRATGKIMFTTTTWIDKQAADKFYKSNFEDNGNNAVGLFSSNVLYYTEGDKEGIEVHIPNTFNVPMGKKQLVEEPVFENKDISKEVPYTSFDEEGNELTLYRTVTSQEKVQVGTNKVEKTVIDKSIMNNLASYCYERLIEEMGKLFPSDKIQIV